MSIGYIFFLLAIFLVVISVIMNEFLKTEKKLKKSIALAEELNKKIVGNKETILKLSNPKLFEKNNKVTIKSGFFRGKKYNNEPAIVLNYLKFSTYYGWRLNILLNDEVYEIEQSSLKLYEEPKPELFNITTVFKMGSDKEFNKQAGVFLNRLIEEGAIKYINYQSPHQSPDGPSTKLLTLTVKKQN